MFPSKKSVGPAAEFAFLHPEVGAPSSLSLSPAALLAVHHQTSGFLEVPCPALMRPDFFLTYKIIGVYDNSFTMSQLEKCNNLVQEAEKSS